MRDIGCVLILVSMLAPVAASAHEPLPIRVAEATSEIERSPGAARSYLIRAELYRLERAWDAARADCDRAAALDPDLATVDLCRGALAYDRGDAAAARVHLDRYLQREPGSARGHALLARVLEKLREPLTAAAELDRAIALDAHPSPDLFLDRARLVETGDPGTLDRALSGLEEGLARLGPVPSLEKLASELRGRGATAPTHVPAAMRVDAQPSLAASVGSQGATVALVRGPYLQMGTPTAMTIRWRTDVATDSRISFGPLPDDLSSSIADTGSVTEHELRLTSLAPGTRYFYAVGSSAETLGAPDSVHFFWTAPPPGTVQSTRIWVIGDSGLPGVSQRQVRDAYYGFAGPNYTDVWLMLGDNAYFSGTDGEYQSACFDVYQKMLCSTVLWPTRGNHELLFAGDDNDYYDLFTLPAAAEGGGSPSGTEAYYSFDHANIHFVCLDSQGSDLTPGGAMLTWLADDLAATTQDWIVAYWHHPPYSKGSHDSDYEFQLVDMRRYVLPVLEAGGVDLVLTGHSHSYERSHLLDEHYGLSTTLVDSMLIDDGDGRISGDGPYHKTAYGQPAPHEGAVYAVVGSSSQISGGTLNHPVMVTSLNELGSLVVHVEANVLEATFLDQTGNARDDFAIVKGGTSAADRAAYGGPGAPAAWPNPSLGSTSISYALSRAGHARLELFDASGRRVAVLVDEVQAAGPQRAQWNGRDARGAAVKSGAYFARLRFAGAARQVKVLLVR